MADGTPIYKRGDVVYCPHISGPAQVVKIRVHSTTISQVEHAETIYLVRRLSSSWMPFTGRWVTAESLQRWPS